MHFFSIWHRNGPKERTDNINNSGVKIQWGGALCPMTAQPTHFKGSERPGAESCLGVEGYFGVRRGKYQMITETKPTSLSNP
jgi:hypothetical protein